MASSSVSSSSSACYSSVAGLHGGNYYDLTADDNDDHGHGGGGASGRRRISTTSMVAQQQQQQQHSTSSDSRQRTVSVIDLVDSDDEEGAVAVDRDIVSKKRSLPLHPPPTQQTSSNIHQWENIDRGEVVVAGNSSFSSSTSCFSRHTMRKKRLVMPSSSSTTTTTLVSNNVRHREQQQQQLVTIPTISTSKSYINLPSRTCPRDGATITFGLLSLIDIVCKEKSKDGRTTILTCEGSATASRNKLLNNTPCHQHCMTPRAASTSSSQSSSSTADYHHHHLPYYNHQPFHYLQHDNWSCGYRNLQMLLSSLMPTILHHSTSSSSCTSFSQGVPCIEEIQRTTEKLWSQGYDIRNAEHHKYSLVGKKTWIGAVEVWSYLSFMRIDSIIVQFIKTSQNRALLGRFVWAYFNRVCHTFGCSCCQGSGHRNSRLDGAGSVGVESDPPTLASPILTSLEYADHLLREVTKPKNAFVNDIHQLQQRCQCSIPPLYLQWEGHSVTVVGIKRMDCDNTMHGYRSASSSSSESFSLIIFCPQKDVANVKSALTKEFHSKNAVAAAVYKSDVTIESKKGNNANNSNLELPVTKLLQKDCQILLTTGGTIDEADSKRRTVCSNKIGFLNAVGTT